MKIAYFSIGMASPLHLSFELSRRLVAAGHEVIYLSPADIEREVRAQGHDFVALSADRVLAEKARDHALSWGDLRTPLRFIRRLAARRRLRRRSLAGDEIERRISEIAPDLLLLDIEMHYAILATHGLEVPRWLTMAFFSPYRRPGLPPLHTRLQPAVDGPGRRRIARAWRRLRLETLHFEWRQKLGRWRRCELAAPVAYDTFDHGDLRAVARHRKIPLRRLVSRTDWLRPYLYRHLPILCFNASGMDLPHDSPPNLHYVGAMVDRRRVEARMSSEARSDWSRFRDRARASDCPLVYCSLGSFWSADTAFLRRVVGVFERRRDWCLVIGLGGQVEPDALGELPDNVLALPWAPQLEVLDAADCAITHGGVASINECVRLGVPMVVYSTGFVEQHGNATRVAFYGLGLVADKEKDGAAELENNIAQALTDREIRQCLDRMRESFLAYEKAGLAVELLERSASRAASQASSATVMPKTHPPTTPRAGTTP